MGAGDGRTIFVTAVSTAGERALAARMIASLRAFGGPLADAPVWLFESGSAAGGPPAPGGVETRPLPGEPFDGYPLASKVSACARAEALASPSAATLVWLNPDVLVARPPLLLDLDDAHDVAIRPVHVRNVGLPAGAPPDPYWRGIFDATGVRDPEATVESFVDARRIRPYFNTHAFSVAPRARLFARWRERFAVLAADRAFQRTACADPTHRLFLHQAVLSALVAGAVAAERVRMLPPDYAYPYNLHGSVPAERRAASLDRVVCAACEDRPLDPVRVTDIAIRGRLRAWLAERAARGEA